MILVIKDGRVVAFHADKQDYIISSYPNNCAVIKVKDKEIVFDEEGWPQVPQGGIDLRLVGNVEQRLADLEEALAALLGGGA